LNLLSVCAERGEILHFGQVTIDAALPGGVGRMVEQDDVAG
jgi:hypothetical protein